MRYIFAILSSAKRLSTEAIATPTKRPTALAQKSVTTGWRPGTYELAYLERAGVERKR